MIRVIELFSGIGSQHAALERLGIPYKIVGMAEIDKYAIKSYEAIHGATPNFGDISKIDKLPKADFWTYSFPCQDLSVAGKQKGLVEGTRSGLLYEVERLLEVSKEHDELPTYLMLENVKNLVGKKFKPDFDRWLGKLDQLGYNTYWKVLNAKHYGVPQNRERVFAISIRKDVDRGYQFPEGFDNGLRLKDILEESVDEKFYISNGKAEKLLSQITLKEGERAGIDLTINEPQEPVICASRGRNPDNPSERIPGAYLEQRLEINKENTSNTITTVQKDNYVLIPQATTKGYIECSVPGVFDMTYPDSKTRRGRVQDHGEIVPTLTAASQDIMYVDNITDKQSFAKNKSKEMLDELGYLPEMWNPYNKAEIKDIAPTVTTMCDRAGSSSTILMKQPNYRIRKLTPKECFRLMGFTDEEFYKAEAVNSNSQLYKQAGNSIVVDVLYHLFKNLFVNQEEGTMQISLF